MANPAVSNTFIGLKHTICWDIRGAYPEKNRVPVPEWLEFLRKDVGVNLQDLKLALQHSLTQFLMITLPDEDTFTSTLSKAEQGVEWAKYKVKVYGWSASEEVTKVTLTNITSPLDCNAAIQEMAKHGAILSQKVLRHQHIDVPTGSISLNMRIKPDAELPSFIYEESIGNTITVHSAKHQRTCWKCLERGHIAAFCRKPIKTQAAAAKSKTWAKIAAVPKDTAEMTVCSPQEDEDNWTTVAPSKRKERKSPKKSPRKEIKDKKPKGSTPPPPKTPKEGEEAPLKQMDDLSIQTPKRGERSTSRSQSEGSFRSLPEGVDPNMTLVEPLSASSPILMGEDTQSGKAKRRKTLISPGYQEPADLKAKRLRAKSIPF